ncbi:hypothetical protein J6590_006660 [Homalodisca vitripennis]|nr:hypothetical protein J6590_006660 [Homalodisca vitripennis]
MVVYRYSHVQRYVERLIDGDTPSEKVSITLKTTVGCRDRRSCTDTLTSRDTWSVSSMEILPVKKVSGPMVVYRYSHVQRYVERLIDGDTPSEKVSITLKTTVGCPDRWSCTVLSRHEIHGASHQRRFSS